MPKEITHWIIAKEALLSLQNSTPIKRAILNTENLYFCSATLPDTPYYYRGKKGESLRISADRFHNHQQNSFSAFQQVLQSPTNLSFEAELSAIAGIISHIVTDAVFHPMICFLSGRESGPYRQKAIAKHRIFETSLDLFFLEQDESDAKLLLSQYVTDLEVDQKDLCTILSQLLGIHQETEIPLLVKSIKDHCFCQRQFNRVLPVWLLNFINVLRPNQMDTLLALSYVYVKKASVPFSNKPINYRHPVTGDPYSKRFNELKDDAVLQIIEIFTALNKCSNREDLRRLFQQICGPNLVTGLSDSTSSEMKYFSE